MQKSGGFYFPDNESHFTALGDDVAHYQQPQRDKAYDHVKNWRVAVDIGAHVGLFSSDFAKRFERVISFEPVPRTRECLVLNVPANVEVKPFACGARPGKVTIEYNIKNSGGSKILGDATQANDKMPTTEVEVVTLDSFELPVVDLMKIDVEGFEVDVLTGAQETLRRCRPVVIIEEKVREGNAPIIQQARDILLNNGYEAGPLAGADRIYLPAKQ